MLLVIIIMNHQSQPSRVENIIMSALNPKSTMVYYMANGAIIVLILTLIILYFILESYHLLIMMFLAIGLLASVNYVWMNRIDPDQEESDNDKKTKGGEIGTEPKENTKATTPRRRKKKRKE